jgi:hypothetical protein
MNEKIKISVFCDTKHCSLVDKLQHFEGTCPSLGREVISVENEGTYALIGEQE